MYGEFEIDDVVEIVCTDGKEFRGVLTHFTEDFFTLRVNRVTLGFPFDGVDLMRHALEPAFPRGSVEVL